MIRQQFTQQRMYVFLLILTICNTAGLQVWQTLFDNFAVHVAHLEGQHIGILQSVREIPGFLSLLVVYLLLILKEHRLSALSVLILGIGISATGLLPTFGGMIFTTLVMSFGFHYFETTNQSLTLQYFDKQTAPLVFGRLRSSTAATNVITGLAIIALSPQLEFKQIFLLCGLLIIIAACWSLTRNPTDHTLPPQKKSMVLRRQYWLYYALTFMAGARRQIFVAFAVFLMVKKFSFSVSDIAWLFLLNNMINFFLSRLIGICIVKFGERRVLSLEYASLIFIFSAYALTDSKVVIAALYILDHIFFNFSIAIRTFFQKIADPTDIAPSMAVGFTINHIAAVFLPALGGLLWMIDYRLVFYTGAAMSCVSLLLVQLISWQLAKHHQQ